MKTIAHYYQLAKPGIIYGNAITLAGGFFLASKGMPNLGLFAATLIGLSLVIASGCVFNNYIDRDIDAKMERTKGREFVVGSITMRNGITYGIALGILGVGILAVCTNALTTAIALMGFFFYVVVYSLWAKRGGTFGTHVGAIAGAVPPVVGYCAVTNQFDAGAALLFLILFFWQMPHFFAIGIYRGGEYAAAGIPIVPIKKGTGSAKFSMIRYILLFTVTAELLAAMGFAGVIYLATVVSLGLAWLIMAFGGFKAKDDARWARGMFIFSLIVITATSLVMAMDPVK